MPEETIKLSNYQIISFLLVFFRIGAILLTAPFFGSRNIQIQVRILLSFVLAIVIASAVIPYKAISLFHGEMMKSTITTVMAISREVMLGIAIGFMARLIFTGIQMAGQFIGNDIGFGMMNILDPSNREVVTIISEFYIIIATLIFLATNSHHFILMAIAKSFDTIPLSGWELSGSFIKHLNIVFGGIFSTGLKLALPIMGVLFLAKMAMAVIARTMPQINIFAIGFPIQISLGLIALAIFLPFFIKAMQVLFLVMRDNIWFMFR